MTIKSCLAIIAGLLLAVALAATAAAILVPRLLDLDAVKPRILSLAQEALHRRVSYESASLSREFVPTIVVRKLVIAEQTGDATLLEAERLTFKLALLPLLHKEVRLREVVVERPKVTLTRDRTGALNIDDLFRGKPSAFTVHLTSVRIRNALVRFTDYQVAPAGFTTSLEDLYLDASRLARGETAKFRLATRITGTGGEATATISGTALVPAPDEPPDAMAFDLTLTAGNLDAGRYWPYYGHYLPFEPLRGRLDIAGGIKGTPGEFTTKGDVRIRDLRFSYPEVFHAVLTPKDVHLAYEVELTPRDLAVKSFDLVVDGLGVTGSCTLGDLHGKDPRITARAVTSPFRLEEFRQYIPYGVIVKGPAGFIEQHITGGIYRLDEGRLDGRVSQILHMERGENYNVLYIRGRVDRGVVTFGPDVPVFGSIKGQLEMRGKDFLLHRMAGTFGSSPFALEGKIADYPLDTPASYPFTMTITPGEAEIAWLLRQEEGTSLDFGGPSLLSLSGSGTLADYRLAGSWDLTGADYRYRELAHKPAGMANDLRFAVRLGDTDALLEDFRYGLHPLDLTATATYRYDDRSSLRFTASTNRFPVDPFLSMVPALGKYRPSGSVQAGFSGGGDPTEPDGIRLKGDVILAGFSAQPFRQTKLRDISGTIHVTEAALETEQLSGRVGDSPFSVAGRVIMGAEPAVDLTVSSAELHPEDLGFHASERVPAVTNLSGSISLKGDSLTIVSLSGGVKSTRFTLGGTVPDLETPEITLHADFPSLVAEDLAPLTRLRRADEEPSPDMVLKARVTAAVGSVGEVAFERLDTDLTLQEDRLDVHSLKAGVLGGTASGTGEADFAAEDGPRCRVKYRLEGADAARIMKAAGWEGRLTGLVTADGEVTARGKTAEQLKGSVLGNADLIITDGQLRLPANGLKTSHELPFKRVQTRLSLAGKVLAVPSARIDAFGGVATGEGSADFGNRDEPGYHLRCGLENIDAATFFRAVDATRDISGLLTLKADLTARGNDLIALKRTIRGSATIGIRKGVVNKLGLVSKVLSVLNVSQLLDFRLPDLVSEGMPYDRIDGTFAFDDGKVATKDLSLLSPSLDMSLVGNADLVSRDIDITIGVQPLQTTGKIVHRIPIIGWLLTGGDKRLLVVYYKAKGNWDNPKISAIPDTELSRGVYNIFKRAFNLPEELVVEPGKVILGE